MYEFEKKAVKDFLFGLLWTVLVVGLVACAFVVSS